SRPSRRASKSSGVHGFEQPLEQPPSVGPAVRRLHNPLRVRHEAEHVAGIVEDPRDVPRRSVDGIEVAERHAAFALEPVESRFVRLVIAVVMRDREQHLFAAVILRGEQALAVLDLEAHRPADEAQPRVAHQRARKQPSLGQHLETVADSDHRHAARRGVFHRAHHRRPRRHGARTQIIAVRKAARNADEIDAVGKLTLLVPDHRRLAPGHQLQRDGKVAVAVRSGKYDDGALHGLKLIAAKYAGNLAGHASCSRSIRKFSITVLASSLRHMSSISESFVPSARSSSISLPARTSLTPENPSPSSAWWMALPWGSRTPGLRVMKTRAFMGSLWLPDRTGTSRLTPPRFPPARRGRPAAGIRSSAPAAPWGWCGCRASAAPESRAPRATPRRPGRNRRK